MPDDPTPDSPPTEPFDVPTSPDSPPTVPFDVRTYPDGPPFATFPVDVQQDDPPVAPFDVTLRPDGPPVTPVNVQTSPDSPPVDPVDVPISLDAPSIDPFNVTTTPDGPVDDPVNVPITLDRPPVAPVNVAITPSRPPAVPFDVPTYPDVPALQVESSPGEPPTMDQIVNAVIDFDHTLGTFLSALVEIDPVTVNGPGGGALDPTILARWFRDYTNAVGPAGVAKFVAEQTVLYAMNPTVAKIFDPTYFLKMLIPGSMGHIKTALDVETGLTMETVAQLEDSILQAKVAFTLDRPAGNGAVDRMDIYGPDSKYTDGQAFTVDSMVDTVLDNGSFASVPLVLRGAGTERRARFDASVLFEDRRSDGSSMPRGSVRLRAASGVENVSKSKLAQSAGLDGVIPASIMGEQDDGSVLSTTQDPSQVIDDDDARVPLSFTDLRKDPIKNAYRSVYFRPLNLNFSNAISPEWAETSTFGRVDPTPGYQRTKRSFSVSFELHAFSPEDLQVMYNKMTWLSSMCYPTYGNDSLFKSGPVCRMRIGDAVSTGLGGVPGIITGLSFDFAEALWELRKGMKVPRSFKVSVEFTAIHDGPVGILNGVFGVLQLPAPGKTPDRNTNFAGGPNDSRDVAIPDGATVLPGLFSRFGESRK
jgi:hypothetical protein